MKRSRFYLGLVLLLGLLCVANIFKSRDVKATNAMEAQVGWAVCHVPKIPPAHPAVEAMAVTGMGTMGGFLGAKYGATIGWIGGPAGACVGAVVGAF
ncbi:hypothetical protein JMN12_07135 [Capnocytophaga genosp. AHN8471]|jgi:hypothetical protein|uniref:hypothetical protein n=1 Tax=Capnocytophaga genosp. AHN8471 TaxID=327574 RepID=UPI0019318BF0|nr:hypothetical protein [Capnocytophaga genosp. AHN8471]MBM0656330.1 hypothetical protein [Capnocytophaga genosp. AHN8471]